MTDTDPSPAAPTSGPVDLLVAGAELVATVDDERRELAGGWVAITDGLVHAIGASTDPVPEAKNVLRADGCLVTPGLINTHHHIYQNLTRSYKPAVNGTLFQWLTTLYPKWSRLDEEAAYVSAWIGLAELALGGCTTSTDHLYVHPRGGGDLITAEITAAQELGFRFHPTRGSMSRSQKDGGLPPDSVVQTDDELMLATAELAERLDVRLHTHLAEDPDEDTYSAEVYGRRTIDQFEAVGWGSDRSWVAHCIYPNEDEITRMGQWGTGVAHCPSSNMMIGGGGIAPVHEFRAAGVPVGIGCDGSASTDSASLWMEARNALLLARMRKGPQSTGARDALEIATRGSAACLGREGELGVLAPGAVGDLVCWPLEGIKFAGALSDPIEAWLRCGPVSARHTVVNGSVLVEGGELTMSGVDTMLDRHRAISLAMQAD